MQGHQNHNPFYLRVLDYSVVIIWSYTVLENFFIIVDSSSTMLGYDWWLCMVINISVQYSGGLLPDIILLLTHGYYQWGTRLNTMQWLSLYL